jgi:S-adenosylmethionine-diacylgycerolhomoserine-N-methlytransferase
MNEQAESLHPQARAMDRMYRFQRHIYDASRHYYLLGRDKLLDDLNPPPGGSVLEIGCGTGRNLVRVASRYPDARLFGIDISQEMLKSALKQKGLGAAVKFACVDATSFDAKSSLGRAKFDRIYFSYTLSMVPQWKAALRHAHSLLAEGGELHIVDFGQSENLPASFRSMLFRWLAAFHVSPRQALKTILHQLARETGAAIHFKSRFRGYAWQAAIRLAPAPQPQDP